MPDRSLAAAALINPSRRGSSSELGEGSQGVKNRQEFAGCRGNAIFFTSFRSYQGSRSWDASALSWLEEDNKGVQKRQESAG